MVMPGSGSNPEIICGNNARRTLGDVPNPLQDAKLGVKGHHPTRMIP